jgi:hypothetical protein
MNVTERGAKHQTFSFAPLETISVGPWDRNVLDNEVWTVILNIFPQPGFRRRNTMYRQGSLTNPGSSDFRWTPLRPD